MFLRPDEKKKQRILRTMVGGQHIHTKPSNDGLYSSSMGLSATTTTCVLYMYGLSHHFPFNLHSYHVAIYFAWAFIYLQINTHSVRERKMKTNIHTMCCVCYYLHSWLMIYFATLWCSVVFVINAAGFLLYSRISKGSNKKLPFCSLSCEADSWDRPLFRQPHELRLASHRNRRRRRTFPLRLSLENSTTRRRTTLRDRRLKRRLHSHRCTDLRHHQEEEKDKMK